MYLLTKDDRPLWENERVKKGLRRVLMLITLGYLLKWGIFSIVTLRAYPTYFTVDVLHCIGFAILGLISVYALHRIFQFSLRVSLFTLAVFIFFLEPYLKAADWSQLPSWLANYFTTANGSTFTLFPWMAYTFMGGVLGVWLNRNAQIAFTKSFPWILFTIGAMFALFSSHWVHTLHEMTGWASIRAMFGHSYLFTRLGNVLIAVSAVIWITRWWKSMPALVTKIGGETLTIYAVHYVILFGTWFGVGLATFWKQALSPIPAAIGALLFIISFVYLIKHIELVRHIVYNQIPDSLWYAYRIARIKLVRFYLKARRPVKKILLAFIQ